MLNREEWLPLARKLDWDYSRVREDEIFPEVISGRPWLPHTEWKDLLGRSPLLNRIASDGYFHPRAGKVNKRLW